MKIAMIGGTGLLGYSAAIQLIDKGYEVKTLSLSPLPKDMIFSNKLEIVFGNYLEMSDNDLKDFLTGSEDFIFAAGIDERVEGPAPIYNLYEKYNITGLKRILDICREVNIINVVVLGSYFSYFHKKYPKLQLTKHHPYIKSRIDQENLVLSYDFNLSVIEIPYVFGIQKGRKPVWTILVDIIKKQKISTFYTKGGTTMITVKQAGQAIANALLKNKGKNIYPIGFYNKSWTELLEIVHEEMGYKRKVITVPTFLYKIYAYMHTKKLLKKGVEPGLNLVKYAKLQATNLFIEKSEAAIFLEIEEDDIKQAIKDSIRLSLEVIEQKYDEIIEMKI